MNAMFDEELLNPTKMTGEVRIYMNYYRKRKILPWLHK